jgi:hypothetical protein
MEDTLVGDSILTVQQTEKALREILAVKGNELSYPINKNLHKIKKALEPLQDEAKGFDDLHYVVDENGNRIKFLAVEINQRLFFKKDEKGKYIAQDDREIDPKSETWLERIDIEKEEYKQGTKDLNSKRLNIEWTKFDTETFNKVKKLLDGIDYTILFDVGIID